MLNFKHAVRHSCFSSLHLCQDKAIKMQERETCDGNEEPYCYHGDAPLSCQVEQLKEELTQSQSEKEELRQRVNQHQQEVSAVRDTPLCLLLHSFFPFSFFLFFLPSFLLACVDIH